MYACQQKHFCSSILDTFLPKIMVMEGLYLERLYVSLNTISSVYNSLQSIYNSASLYSILVLRNTNIHTYYILYLYIHVSNLTTYKIIWICAFFKINNCCCDGLLMVPFKRSHGWYYFIFTTSSAISRHSLGLASLAYIFTTLGKTTTAQYSLKYILAMSFILGHFSLQDLLFM